MMGGGHYKSRWEVPEVQYTRFLEKILGSITITSRFSGNESGRKAGPKWAAEIKPNKISKIHNTFAFDRGQHLLRNTLALTIKRETVFEFFIGCHIFGAGGQKGIKYNLFPTIENWWGNFTENQELKNSICWKELKTQSHTQRPQASWSAGGETRG